MHKYKTMTSNSTSKLIQAISYAINQYSALPLVSRMHLYNTLHDYIIAHDVRITTLENKLAQIQSKLDTCDMKDNNNKNTKKLQSSMESMASIAPKHTQV